MALISLKVGDEFLEMDKASIRISYTNNLFESGAAPGINSYPFDLPATNNNLRILGQHNRLDNPESLLGTVSVSLFLEDSLYFNALLNFQSIGKNIKASLTPTLTKAYSDFSSQKLSALDYGQFNKYWLPETYRYSIANYSFFTGDTLTIDVGVTTYTQPFLTTGIETMLALLDQVNADTATNGAWATYLKIDNLFGTDFGFAILIKGTAQFSIYPQAITDTTNSRLSHYMNHFNDSFYNKSNEATHVKFVSENKELYELAFGQIPWWFPIIYNEDFFGTPEVLSTYDYFINTFKASTNGYLTRYATNFQENKSRGDIPCCPQPLLSFILESAFKNFALNLETTFFQDPELANLVMLNLYHSSKIFEEEPLYMGPQHFEMKKAVADITIEDLCVGMKKTFSQHFFFDFQNAKVIMLSSREILDSTDFIDLNPILLADISIEPFEDYANGFKFKYQFSDADKYSQDEIKNLEQYIQKNSVLNIGALPVTGNHQSQVRLVYVQNQFYLVEDLTNIWTFISHNFLEEIIGNGKFSLESDLVPVLMLKNAGQKTGTTTDPESGDLIPVITPSGFLVPKLKMEGNSLYHKQTENTWQGRLMFYRGFEHTTYPFANYDVYDASETARWNYSLKLTGPEGTINQFHEPFIRNLSAIKKGVTAQALLSKEQILNYKIWKYHRVENQNMLCAKMDVIFDNATNTIKPAQLELYKK